MPVFCSRVEDETKVTLAFVPWSTWSTYVAFGASLAAALRGLTLAGATRQVSIYGLALLTWVSGCGGPVACEDGMVVNLSGQCESTSTAVPRTAVGSGSTSTTSDSDDGTDVDTDGSDTVVELRNINVETLFISGHFGFDSLTGEIVPTVQQGAPLPSRYELLFGTNQFTGDLADEANYCAVWYDLDGYFVDPSAQDNGFLFGVSIPQGPGDAMGGTNCAPNAFFDNVDPWTMYRDVVPWAFEVGGEPSGVVEDWLDQVVAVQDHPLFIGGAISADPMSLPSLDEAIYFTAFDVDAGFNVLGTQMARDEVDDGNGGLVTGLYRLGSVYYWTFQ